MRVNERVAALKNQNNQRWLIYKNCKCDIEPNTDTTMRKKALFYYEDIDDYA